MRQRCDNEKCINYINYGARGITYDRRWEDFEEFLKDMGERPSGLSLDRIDNNSGYSKENCRWATRTVQNRNTRRAHLFNGKTLKEWSEILGVRRGTLAQRYYVYGWSVDRVLGIIK